MQRLNSIKHFLHSQNLIRIAIDITPGFGNQVASFHLMERLRKLGFKGLFEVIFSLAGKEKVSTLFNLPKDFEENFVDKNKGIKFISVFEHLRRFQNNTLETVNFGMTGAMDYGSQRWNESEKRLLKEVMNIDNGGFNSDLLKVKIYIRFDSRYNSYNYIYKAGIAYYKPFPQENSKDKFFQVPPSPHLFDGYLASDEFAEINKKNPALSTFIFQIQKQLKNFLGVYGHQVTENYAGYEWNIWQIITGARYAQMNGPKEFSKPLIIAVFYDYQKEIEALKKFIHAEAINLGNITNTQRMVNAIKELHIPDILSFAHLSDPDTATKIQNLKPGNILLLSMGSLPWELMDRLHAYESVFSPIREGASSFNNLILTGRPHMRCGWRWDYDHPFKNASLQKWFNEFYNVVCRGERSWEERGDKIPQMVGEYFIRGYDRNSSLSQWFLSWSQESLNPNNDRILVGLDGGIKLLDEPISVVQAREMTAPKPSQEEFKWKGKHVATDSEAIIVLIGQSIIAGLSETLKYSLQKKNHFSKRAAEGVKCTAYFTSTFAMHFCHSYLNKEPTDDWQRTTSSLCEAGIKTGKLLAVHVGLFATTKLIPYCVSISEETLETAKKTLKNTYFAYQLWKKPLAVGLGALAGTASEMITQKLGKMAVDRSVRKRNLT